MSIPSRWLTTTILISGVGDRWVATAIPIYAVGYRWVTKAIFISGIMICQIAVTVSIPIVVVSSITSVIFPLIFWRMMSRRLISKTRPVRRVLTAIIVSLHGKIAPTMWTDITNSKILATQTGLRSTWVLKVYICSLRQLSVAKTHLQQFHYLSILKLWKLTKDLCIKLGSPASEHPAQIIFRIVVHEILILAELLIFEFKFCPVWLARISERIWWANIPLAPTCVSVEEFLIPEIYGSSWRHRRYLLHGVEFPPNSCILVARDKLGRPRLTTNLGDVHLVSADTTCGNKSPPWQAAAIRSGSIVNADQC